MSRGQIQLLLIATSAEAAMVLGWSLSKMSPGPNARAPRVSSRTATSADTSSNRRRFPRTRCSLYLLEDLVHLPLVKRAHRRRGDVAELTESDRDRRDRLVVRRFRVDHQVVR